MAESSVETIAAIATARGQASVGIIRVSGAGSAHIARQILGQVPRPRLASLLPFRSTRDGSLLDEGIALYFPAPHSYTGEDVLELQAHGGPVLLDMLLEEVLSQGARLARPGEFTERAFLNDKLDLLQAEAVADLIAVSSREALLSAGRSLKGQFSTQTHTFIDTLVAIRSYLEAALDFSEEEIDFLADGDLIARLDELLLELKKLLEQAQVGLKLRDGIRVVLAGPPNAGKSSLLNALAGEDKALVTEHAGTTRDILELELNLAGLPLHVFDTAGLRESDDPVEQLGIARARQAITQADAILLITEYQGQAPLPHELWLQLMGPEISMPAPVIQIQSKIDLYAVPASRFHAGSVEAVSLSAKTGEGLSLLTQVLKEKTGFINPTEGVFLARRRHLEALKQAAEHIQAAHQLLVSQQYPELAAEELRAAQSALEALTGRFTADDLLGKIFADFCIGK